MPKTRKYTAHERKRLQALERIRGLWLAGFLHHEIKEKIQREMNLTPQAAGRWTTEAFREIQAAEVTAEKLEDDKPRNLAAGQARLEYLYRLFLEQGDNRHALQALDRLFELQGLKGPRSVTQVAIGIQNNGHSGPPVERRTSGLSDEELVERARQKGLPTPPTLSLDQQLRGVSREAARRGDVLVISKEDAKRVQEAG